MKKLVCISLLLFLPFASIYADEIPDSQPQKTNPTNPANTTKIPPQNLGNNIKFGIFIGLGIGYDSLKSKINTSKNLVTYDYSSDPSKAGGNPGYSGINFEGRLGLIKTTKNFGVRIYGYYGKTFDDMTTLGLDYTPLNADCCTKTSYFETEYYGAIGELLFGSFQSGGLTAYFSIGGGYQFNNSDLAGRVSLGYGNTYGRDEDVYSLGISGKKSYQTPVGTVGAGIFMTKHSMFEINFRYLFKTPSFEGISLSEWNGYSGVKSHVGSEIPDDTPVIIRNVLKYHYNIAVNYMFVF